MARSSMLALLAGACVMLAGSNARALTVETQLTPQNISRQERGFSITMKDAGELREFEVIVRPKSGRLLPALFGRLYLYSSDGYLAELPVQEKRKGKEVSYWFRVSRKLLERSRFEYSEYAGTVSTDAEGNRVVTPYIGGTIYWFYLRDFAQGTPAAFRAPSDHRNASARLPNARSKAG